VKPNINSVEVHPQLSSNGRPVDGALVGAGSLWPIPKSGCLCPNYEFKKKIGMEAIQVPQHNV
jgi:hypothetical protein